MVELSNTARIFKALGNEQRLKLFLMVHRMGRKGGTVDPSAANEATGACCKPVKKAFSAACACLGLAPSTISHHFKALQDAGLISCTRDGQSFLCQVNEEAQDTVRQFLR
jgi:ArsR family transcriptional regulator